MWTSLGPLGRPVRLLFPIHPREGSNTKHLRGHNIGFYLNSVTGNTMVEKLKQLPPLGWVGTDREKGIRTL